VTTLVERPDALDAAPRVEASAEDVLQGRLSWLQAEASQREGPVLRIDIPYGPEAGPCISLVSPELAQDALLANRHRYSSAEGWAPLVGSGFGYAILNVDEPEHAEHRKLILPAFSSPALARCMPNLLRIIDEELERWSGAGTFDLFPAMRRLTYQAVARGVGGMTREETDETFATISVILDGYNFWKEGRDAFLARATVARAAFLDVISTIVARRRTGEGRGDGTFLDIVLQAVPPADGPRDPAVAFVAILLIAGHDTGMVTYSRALYELGRRPEIADRVARELAGAGGTASDPPAFDVLDRLPYLDRTMLEINRLWPAIINMPRTAREDLDVGGYRIRRGTRIAIAVGGVHLRRDLHADPLRFDPDRFADPAAADLARPFQNLAFAGGGRHCLGMRLAHIEFKSIVARATLRYRIEPEDPAPLPYGGFWVARAARPMRVTITAR
jgi:retinoid hydroxylase